jgi:hypothetical protein
MHHEYAIWEKLDVNASTKLRLKAEFWGILPPRRQARSHPGAYSDEGYASEVLQKQKWAMMFLKQ